MSGIEILLNDHRGIYIPRDFVNYFDEWNISKENIECLKKGPNPDNDHYWDTWSDVLNEAYFIDKNGNRWQLYQDGDLFTYCESLMTDDEKKDLFGE